MEVVLKLLDRRSSLKAMRLLLAYAKDKQMMRNAGRLKSLLSDLLPKHPVERDLLQKAISLNAIATISEAKTQAEVRGAVHSLLCSLLARHVSPEGAEFAATVVALAIKVEDPELSRSWESHLTHVPWLGTRAEPRILKIEMPRVTETIEVADIETRTSRLTDSVQFDIFAGSTVTHTEPIPIA
ncbi:MAG: hypothetical protein AAF662_05260 [Pseudomonadota bacterium]